MYQVHNCKAFQNGKCTLYEQDCVDTNCLIKCFVNRVEEFNADKNILCDIHLYDTEEGDYV